VEKSPCPVKKLFYSTNSFKIQQTQFMIAKLFLALTEFSFFRRLVWKPVYNFLAKNYKLNSWTFMNYGYVQSHNEEPLHLKIKDKINEYHINLYHYLATKINCQGLHVLEVGSGRGGGAAYITEYLKPKSLVGLDLSENAVILAQNIHKVPGLSFLQGSAEKLPFTTESIDAIINVESCHAYGSVSKFLQEVCCVLKPGGYLLLTDMRDSHGMKKLKNELLSSGLILISEENISANVARAIEDDNNNKKTRINLYISGWRRKWFEEFAGVTGSQIHKDLLSGGLIYYRFVLQKSGNV
jgi:ubiquinone/menaquinone biosynthesis C-methylase UbiE